MFVIVTHKHHDHCVNYPFRLLFNSTIIHAMGRLGIIIVEAFVKPLGQGLFILNFTLDSYNVFSNPLWFSCSPSFQSSIPPWHVGSPQTGVVSLAIWLLYSGPFIPFRDFFLLQPPIPKPCLVFTCELPPRLLPSIDDSPLSSSSPIYWSLLALADVRLTILRGRSHKDHNSLFSFAFYSSLQFHTDCSHYWDLLILLIFGYSGFSIRGPVASYSGESSRFTGTGV